MNLPQGELVPESSVELKRRVEFHKHRGTFCDRVEAQLSPLFDQSLMLFNGRLVENSVENTPDAEVYFCKFQFLVAKTEKSLKQLTATIWVLNLVTKYNKVTSGSRIIIS